LWTIRRHSLSSSPWIRSQGTCSLGSSDEFSRFLLVFPAYKPNKGQKLKLSGQSQKYPQRLSLRPEAESIASGPSSIYALGGAQISDVELRSTFVIEADLEHIVSNCTHFTEESHAGFPDYLHRVSRRLNLSNARIGLSIRVGRESKRATWMILNETQRHSILLLGAPGLGNDDVPHPAIGRARRLMVPSRSRQHQMMIEAVQNRTPQVIVIDEIGTRFRSPSCLCNQSAWCKHCWLRSRHIVECLDQKPNTKVARWRPRKNDPVRKRTRKPQIRVKTR